jgi:hypothetical protein
MAVRPEMMKFEAWDPVTANKARAALARAQALDELAALLEAELSQHPLALAARAARQEAHRCTMQWDYELPEQKP